MKKQYLFAWLTIIHESQNKDGVTRAPSIVKGIIYFLIIVLSFVVVLLSLQIDTLSSKW